VVDDNPHNLALMEAQLRRAGHAVVTETSGRAALDAARGQPDLIFLDVMMPGLDGYEVCRRLKTDPVTRAIPVVMLTSLRERDDKVRAIDAGADDFISKSVDGAEIATRVRSLLRLRHLDDDLARSREEIAAQAEQLAVEKGRAEAILYSIGDGVFTTDLRGCVTMLNPSAGRSRLPPSRRHWAGTGAMAWASARPTVVLRPTTSARCARR
jgi:putative two-component system response regulator